MARLQGGRGTTTPEYRALHSNFADVCNGISPDLTAFATRAFSAKLIGDEAFSQAKNPHNAEFGRASTLLHHLLLRVELNSADFDTILTILQDMPSQGEVVRMLQQSLQANAASSGLPQANGASNSPATSSSSSKFDERPSHAVALLPIADKWKQIGTLLGVLPGKLNGIHQRTVDDGTAMLEMIGAWLSMTSASWRGLLDAVRLVDQKRAEEIEKEFLSWY